MTLFRWLILGTVVILLLAAWDEFTIYRELRRRRREHR